MRRHSADCIVNLSTGQRAYLHRYGPWTLVGGVILAALGLEAARHHVLTEQSALFFVILIPTIVIHEVTHGVVALWCGDTTAKDNHRLTLNPLRHIDPLGTIVVPLLLILTTGLAFGWAKPVPVNMRRLRHPRNQELLVSLSGPAINIVIAVIAGVLLRIFGDLGVRSVFVSSWPLIDQIFFLVGFTNVVIAVFNLIPIPPLDGSVVLERFLPAAALPAYFRIRSFSIVFVFALVFFFPGALNSLFNHAVSLWASTLGLNPGGGF